MTGQECHNVVLVVEDDLDVRQAIAEVLEDNAYHPVEVSNGLEAIETLRACGTGRKPCLILLDIMMPVMDGREFLLRQRQDPDMSDIPVVVLSAHASLDEPSPDLQADGYLRKPVRAETLLSAVRRLCPPEA
jgi:CheY-like chemotaxis protein